jgi:hypothetical protein
MNLDDIISSQNKLFAEIGRPSLVAVCSKSPWSWMTFYATLVMRAHGHKALANLRPRKSIDRLHTPYYSQAARQKTCAVDNSFHSRMRRYRSHCGVDVMLP